MTTVLAAIGLIAMVMIIMAVGVMFKRSPLKGSCGGKGGEDCLCDIENRRRECEIRDKLLDAFPIAGPAAAGSSTENNNGKGAPGS